MRVHIPLPVGTSASRWAHRHERGEVPDASPYGLHHLQDHGWDVTFGGRELTGPVARIARSVRYRTSGLELVEVGADLRRMSRTESDVVLGYDERTGVPAALAVPRSRFAPVVTGVGWLTSRAAAAPLQRRLAARALPRAAAVWTQCSAMLPMLGREWQVPAERLHYVPLGIDTDFYAEQPWEQATATVVSAGEDVFRDHALLVEAVRRVSRHVPAVRLELATSHPIDLPDDLGTLHTRRMDGAMRGLYARSSVVAVALKRTSTGSGLTVVLEAMASGRPIVVTANPGMSDYVEHGVDGLLVPPDDVDAFAAALRELLADPQRCAEMGRAAAARARAEFTSAAMSAVLAGILASSV
ncbi:glycosyltransferase family 4 protein [Aeromicrobium wangtongii]|uniref:glycosyltransferase family 4 protein n=1 Tax=Aeromicrobium wangtongii TaxID=2969247 RepID=UPI002016E425|nr:glycosyltransferase family 4 protein [Aeromicrobium wangtongii]MCL3819896.1 glycosyltransferase family 4 protein [Aeromicrobium wangtongii]